jgi:hypothetical protein
MRLLKLIWRWCRQRRHCPGGIRAGIDSHKWETKFEILRGLADKHR